MKRLLEIFLVCTFIGAVIASAQGRVVSEAAMFSTNFNAERMVRVYLPPSYESEPKKKYPVLYVHDGQNAFSTVGDNVAFGWGNWQLDRTVDELSKAGRMAEIILVAVDCSRQRYADYRGPAGGTNDNSRYEKYAAFLIDELKPRIDREYRTQRGAASTGLLGSSMGGICSVALAWEHPEVFGRAASLSGAFQVEKRNFIGVLKKYSGPRKPVKIYLDSGVVDYSGGDDGRKNTEAVAAELRRIGWRDGRELTHFVDEQPMDDAASERAGLRRDKWKEAQTSQHNEFYWRVRAWRALTFLFPAKDN